MVVGQQLRSVVVTVLQSGKRRAAQSFLATKSANAAYVGFIVFYALCFVVTYVVYVRKSEKQLEGV
ncbi:hypothetical protein [Nakamurella sp. PAMC28650]|uniref:hypothetical protein n=1 Tax=Nakamurella sp. PAMC28650 TaxID=2762325 RepID=UPI00164E3852|nr:hypothetical protein [Nakamurella sp. PAMC28650]QNK81687.1 hypothetical protein H7F38_02435 [Nakamurella sp. PAMC28650]